MSGRFGQGKGYSGLYQYICLCLLLRSSLLCCKIARGLYEEFLIPTSTLDFWIYRELAHTLR